MRILVVEDDNFIAKALIEVLSSQNYVVEVASDGQAGWELIQVIAYDLIVLDVMLPKLDGISLCRRLRESGYQTPVLLLTGRNTGHDKAIGLDAGADDYLVKPFDLEELFARVRALLRRGTSTPPILEWENLRLNPSSCEVFYGTQPVNLTPKEYALLELFLRNSNRVFSCSAILDNIWAFDKTPGEEAVRTQIKGLRQKLKAVGAPPDWLDTVYGIGYRLKPLEGKTAAPATATNIEVTAQKTRSAISSVWQKYKSRISDQVAVIAATAANLRQDTIDLELQTEAEREAHTLAGSLGTFGFKAGSEIAREIEGILQSREKNIARLDELVSALRQEIERSPNAATQTAPPSPKQRPLLAEAKVMVVDDDPQILATVKELLEPWGIIVITLDAPQRFWQTLSAFTPELLILDINMPQLSGTELCQIVKSNPQWRELPIIFLTAQTDQTALDRVLAVGGDDFVSKPIVGAELVVRIVNRLEQLKKQQQENNRN